MNNDKFEQDYFRNRGLLSKGTLTLNHYWAKYIKPNKKTRRADSRLLDLGCGIGHLIKKAEQHYESFGIDISKWAVDYCNTTLKTGKAIQGDIKNLSFPNDYFDIVCAFDVLEHIDKKDLPLCISEIKRCLKKDGILVITTPNLTSLLVKTKKTKWHGFTDKTHVSLLKPKEWEKLLDDGGIHVKSVYGSGLWDVPFIPVIPNVIQKYLFAAPWILLFALGVKFPLKMSDTLVIVAKV